MDLEFGTITTYEITESINCESSELKSTTCESSKLTTNNTYRSYQSLEENDDEDMKWCMSNGIEKILPQFASWKTLRYVLLGAKTREIEMPHLNNTGKFFSGSCYYGLVDRMIIINAFSIFTPTKACQYAFIHYPNIEDFKEYFNPEKVFKLGQSQMIEILIHLSTKNKKLFKYVSSIDYVRHNIDVVKMIETVKKSKRGSLSLFESCFREELSSKGIRNKVVINMIM
jgi:hypothetical protein